MINGWILQSVFKALHKQDFNTEKINITKFDWKNREKLKMDCYKKKAKIIITVTITIIALIVLFTPIRLHLNDGGSVRYKSFVYEVTKIHRIAIETNNGDLYYIDGFEVKIFGISVYRKTNE